MEKSHTYTMTRFSLSSLLKHVKAAKVRAQPTTVNTFASTSSCLQIISLVFLVCSASRKGKTAVGFLLFKVRGLGMCLLSEPSTRSLPIYQGFQLVSRGETVDKRISAAGLRCSGKFRHFQSCLPSISSVELCLTRKTDILALEVWGITTRNPQSRLNNAKVLVSESRFVVGLSECFLVVKLIQL